jgi:sugar/nucleoside kinase (ribokinase family)
MSSPKVVSLGTMLVEIMRIALDEPFEQSGTFAGPFPSGDTPVYVNAVARLGHSAGFIGAVGQDGFGRCILNRFAEQGVDATHVRVLPDRTTGIAFVSYASDGSRQFIFHWREAAAGQIGPDYVPEDYCASAAWLHLTGGNLVITDASYEACLRAMKAMPPGARVSFDPNIRREWLNDKIMHQWQPIIARADYILPSAGEAMLMLGMEDDEAACRQLAGQGKVVLQKRGELGCRVFANGESFAIQGYAVPEIDPTGAGDTFCAGFTAAMLDNLDLRSAARFANAVGALAVTRKGPMEGAPTRKEVDELMRSQPHVVAS